MRFAAAQFPRICAQLQTQWYMEANAGMTNTPMTDLGKLLIFLGAVLVVAGVVLTLLGKTNLPLGRLPGDIVYRGKNTTVYFPLATSVLLSVVLTIVLYVVGRLKK
jgi:hypothetical protein